MFYFISETSKEHNQTISKDEILVTNKYAIQNRVSMERKEMQM